MKRGLALLAMNSVLALSSVLVFRQPTPVAHATPSQPDQTQPAAESPAPEPVAAVAEAPIATGLNHTWEASDWEWLWVGGAQDSLVSMCVGMAEGTRKWSPDGTAGYTRHYDSHIDPGNGVRNQGTFSYQHRAANAAEADQKQFYRLRVQWEGHVLPKAKEAGLVLTPHSAMNAIDLLNQAPATAMGGGRFGWHGYVNLLLWRVTDGHAQNGNYSDEDILFARTKSFINRNGNWTASGLGARGLAVQGGIGWGRVWRDQYRRYRQINDCLRVFGADQGRIPSGW